MKHPQEDLSPTGFATLVSEELDAYYQFIGTRFERLFYFPGQDPFRNESPADAIAALYWGLPKSARRNMTQGLIDVLATRMELVRTDVLNQVVLSIGLIHQVELLKPLVRVVGQRSDHIDDLHKIFSSTVAVAVGFGPVHPALEAARELVNFESFPDDLVYDVLEFLVRDPITPWNDSVIQLLPRMEADYRPDEYIRIKQRLAFVASEIGSRVGLKGLVNGLIELVDGEVDELVKHRFLPRRDPLGMLLAEIFLEHDAPFQIVRRQSGALAISSRDGKQNMTVEGKAVFHALAPSARHKSVYFPFLETSDGW